MRVGFCGISCYSHRKDPQRIPRAPSIHMVPTLGSKV